MRGVVIALGAVFGLMAGPALGAVDDPQGANTVSELVVIANRPPTVEELTVVAQAKCLPPKLRLRSDRPKIVSTYPRQDEVVRPGLLILRITFDQPMACSGFFVSGPGRKNPCSSSEQHFLMSFDHKTVRVACFIEPDVRYTLHLNPPVDPAEGTSYRPKFMSLDYQVLGTAHMTFTASAAAPIDTIPDALSADPETVLADVYRPARKTTVSAPRP